MTRASVAVFIACGDDGRTLADVLRSVRDQTLAPVEILIVDEGSTDLYTRHVLANLERTGQRFLHADATWPAAWYAAIRSTEAAYVLLLDAGALLQPTFIAEAATTLDERAGAAFVTCAPSFGLIDALAGAPLPDAAMFRRQALSAAFGFGEHTERPEERDFWISLLARGFVGAVLPEPLLNPAKAGSHQTSRKPPVSTG